MSREGENTIKRKKKVETKVETSTRNIEEIEKILERLKEEERKRKLRWIEK